MKKLRFLLLDANVVIQLFQLGLWKHFVNKCDVLLTKTVAEEAQFYFDADGQHAIDLTDNINSKRIQVVDVPPGDVLRFRDRFSPVYAERLDPGEADCLTYLLASADPCMVCSGDAIVFRTLARLDLAERGLSLEEALGQIGFGRRLPDHFTKRFREAWTRQGQEERIRGIGLR
ncbi:MAG TPA: hypothetical protein PKK06_14525 [Phycisphaerae bacterium]|nr:hypothetical protein [Phycisphaerae bacterium]HNU46501.1 hypothetical protein [Phycisphaerae bacterium]